MSRVEPLVLRVGDERVLRGWLRSPTMSAGLVQRARIVLLAAEGESNAEVARLVGVSLPTVHSWRSRYTSGGLAALDDLPRPGRPVVHDEQAIIAATLDRPPVRLGVTHWSARLLGEDLDISFATVARVWRRWGLKPWKAETFKFSTDPELELTKHPNVQAWLAKHPRVHLHFTPTSGSWLNMVEIFFGIITRQAIRRGTFHSVRDLETAIGIYIDGWNDRAHPFTWTKNAEQIISHAKPSPNQKKTYNTRH